jgi:MYXO-CTERM domain-containing protein
MLPRVNRSALRALVALSLSGLSSLAHAQTEGCAPDAAGCTRADIAYRWREGLPVEFDFDTNWVPPGAPVQVRIRAALTGNTQVAAAGQLVGSWPEPMQLRTVGTRGAGSVSVDYGVQFSARIRLSLPVEGRTLSWEGAIPYTPRIDFRAMASSPFDPWAWQPVMVAGRTMRVRVADVPLTDALVRIPGISGGFSFEASGDVQATYRSTSFQFGLAADPITEAMPRVLGNFNPGPFVEYQPRLEGTLGYTGAVHVYPSLYVSLAGRRWMLDLADIPIPIGPFPRTVRFDPATARLPLPDLRASSDVVDFGDVDVGRSSERTIELQNVGELDGRATGAEVEAPFAVMGSARTLPVRSRSSFVASFTPVRPGPAESTVVIATNDPDTPRVRVTVRGNGVGAPMDPPVVVDAGTTEDVVDAAMAPPTGGAQDGGCGCRAVTPRGGAWWGGWTMLALLVARRRRRER